MKCLSRSIKLWQLIIFMLSACAANALTLNPLIGAPDGHTLINQEPLLFNEQIIFVTEKEGNYSVWSFDISHNSYTLLQDLETFNSSQESHVIDGFFYFKDSNEPSRVWRSDGTPAGTNPVQGFNAFRDSPLQFQNRLLFHQGINDNNIDPVGFDGVNIRSYDVQYFPLVEDVCAFSLNDVIFPSTNVYAGNDHYLVRYSGQNKTDYTNDLPEDFNVYGTKVWQFENNCFYYITASNFYDVLVIPEVGDKFFLGERIGYPQITEIIRFKGEYFAFGNDTNGGSQLLKLSSDLSQVVKSVEADNYLYFTSITDSQDYLIAFTHSGGAASPPVYATTYYDEDLNVVEGLGGPFQSVPEIYRTAQGETIYFRDFDIQTGHRQNILATVIDQPEEGLVIKGRLVESVITSQDEAESYILIRDIIHGEYHIYALDSLPDMGSQSVGNWYNPDYQSQGMSIVEGLRDDGSRYLFVTLYLFRDGQPLWLAGVADVNYPQAELSLELAEYSGLGLWQADMPANVEKFADMTLSMSSCHRMMMNLETMDGQSINIELKRMVNNSLNHQCKD